MEKKKNGTGDVGWGARCFEAGYAYLVVRKGPEGIAGPRGRRLNDHGAP